MLESEIKKLTAAVEKLTEVMGGDKASVDTSINLQGTGANTLAQGTGPSNIPTQPPTGGLIQPPVQQPPVQQPPVQQPPVQQPPAQVQGTTTGAMDHTLASQELARIVQAMGDPAPVQQLLARYTDTGQLTGVPVAWLDQLVAEAKGLLAQQGAQ